MIVAAQRKIDREASDSNEIESDVAILLEVDEDATEEVNINTVRLSKEGKVLSNVICDKGANSGLGSERDSWLMKLVKEREPTKYTVSGVGSATLTGQGRLGCVRMFIYAGDKSVADPEIFSTKLEAGSCVHNRMTGKYTIENFMNKKNQFLKTRLDGKKMNEGMEIAELASNGLYYYRQDFLSWVSTWTDKNESMYKCCYDEKMNMTLITQ